MGVGGVKLNNCYLQVSDKDGVFNKGFISYKSTLYNYVCYVFNNNIIIIMHLYRLSIQ